MDTECAGSVPRYSRTAAKKIGVSTGIRLPYFPSFIYFLILGTGKLSPARVLFDNGFFFLLLFFAFVFFVFLFLADIWFRGLESDRDIQRVAFREVTAQCDSEEIQGYDWCRCATRATEEWSAWVSKLRGEEFSFKNIAEHREAQSSQRQDSLGTTEKFKILGMSHEQCIGCL